MDAMNGRVDEIPKREVPASLRHPSHEAYVLTNCCPFFTQPPEITVAFLNFKGLSRLVEPFSMGGSISKMMNKLFANREMRILMLGLDAAGKTSTLPFPSLNCDISPSVRKMF
jgi:hypothetical protein